MKFDITIDNVVKIGNMGADGTLFHMDYGPDEHVQIPFVVALRRYCEAVDKNEDVIAFYSGVTDPKEVLDLPMEENDAGAATIREYLKALLQELWYDPEGFGGKRPFGNSGWYYDLYKCLVLHHVVEGKLDSDGCIDRVDKEQAKSIIHDAIAAL